MQIIRGLLAQETQHELRGTSSDITQDASVAAVQTWRETIRFSAQSIASAASTLGATHLSNHALSVEALAVEGSVCICMLIREALVVEGSV